MSAKLARESLELVESAGNNKEYFNFMRRVCVFEVNHRIKRCKYLIKNNGKTQR
jgi:hypothetical protein